MDAPTESSDAPAAGAVQRGHGVRTRVLAGLVFVTTASVLGLAIYLHPSPKGYGTHQQLGMGPCGMLLVTGFPCPSCGMTTAFAHVVRGQWFRGFMAQPAGFALALGCVAACLASARSMIIGRFPAISLAFLTPYRLFLGLLVLLLGGWGFKLLVGLLDGSLPVTRVAL